MLFWSQSTNKGKKTTTNLKRCLQVILVSKREVFHGSRFLHHLYSWAGLLEVSDILGISLLPAAAVLAGVSP